MINLQLPNYRDMGQVQRWFLPLPTRTVVPISSDEMPDVDVDSDDVNLNFVTPSDEVDIEYYRMIAKFIGYGSSWTDNHWNHPEEFAPRGTRCNRCRWFELRIFRELSADPADVPQDTDLTALFDREARADQLGGFIVYKAGMSIAPGEIPYCRYDSIASPHEVVEALTTRKHTEDRGPVAFITKPSAMALASGARFDVDLESAYVNRAVS
jgi:hypothetical protein